MEHGLRMKLIMLFSILLATTTSAYTQELLKVEEVFDYDVGDKFHFRSELVPPNADRVEIIEKYYSADNDTVFYVRYHDRYASSVIWHPEPHLDYNFWTEIDTIFYVMLGSDIAYYWPSYDTSMFSYDTLIYNSMKYCDSLINGYEYATSSFEPDVFKVEYGKGLGRVSYWWCSGSGSPPGVQADWGMFYYQKQGIDCGTPDTLTVSINDHPVAALNFICYPNPFTISVTIEFELSTRSNVQFTVFNSFGSLVHQESIHGMTPGTHTITPSLQHLPAGIYYGILQTSNGTSSIKMIK